MIRIQATGVQAINSGGIGQTFSISTAAVIVAYDRDPPCLHGSWSKEPDPETLGIVAAGGKDVDRHKASFY